MKRKIPKKEEIEKFESELTQEELKNLSMMGRFKLTKKEAKRVVKIMSK